MFNKNFKFLIFLLLLLLLFLSYIFISSKDSKVAEIKGFFPKNRLDKKEKLIYKILKIENENFLSDSDKWQLARAIVQVSEKLAIPDKEKIQDKPIKVEIFLLAWANSRSGFLRISNQGIGILALNSYHFSKAKKEYNIEIEPNYDRENYYIQFKLANLLFKDLLSTGMTIKEAYNQIFLERTSEEWQNLEVSYLKYYELAYSGRF